MENKVFGAFLILLIVTSSAIVVGDGFRMVNAQTPQNDVTLDIQKFTWEQPTLKVIVITEENSSWWQPYYVDSVLRAVGIWNDAFQVFAANHSEFEYVKGLSLVPTFSDDAHSGFDIYVSWTTEPINGGGDNVGLSATYSISGIAVNSSVSLAVNNGFGIALDEVEMQNVVLHELGHSLGLGHCNSLGDIMYPSSLLGSPAQGISTLDVFGVATVCGWLANSSEEMPSDKWPKVSSVGSPSDVAYEFFPLSSANVPPLSVLEPIVGPVRFVFKVILKFVPLELLVIIAAAVAVLAVVSLVYRKREKGTLFAHSRGCRFFFCHRFFFAQSIEYTCAGFYKSRQTDEVSG
ncbi:MAG: matrixin family metalloprotease [Candidatus Bathyarchaeota archaeon]|nr:matrixin family metalloprotease [Candidatus Bathyarchaeota archaeon]